MLALMLHRKQNFQCTIAKDGNDALRFVEDSPGVFNMIFMDGMDDKAKIQGPGIVERIRELGYTNIIVGVVNSSFSNTTKTFMKAGADIVMTKPLKLSALYQLTDFLEATGMISRKDMIIEIDRDNIAWRTRVN
eukprot:gene14221-30252_t